MISYIIGRVVRVHNNKVILEHNQMGYQIFMPTSCIEGELRIGEEQKIYTYLHVKEDALTLFGFAKEDDLEVFELLITVNGIGPKGALGILSGLSADELRFAVLSDDVASISKAPGIGKKTASKLILELKDKLSLEDAFEKKITHVKEAEQMRMELDQNKDNTKEAVLALVALGYSNSEALKAIHQIENAHTYSVEELLKQALKKMAF